MLLLIDGDVLCYLSCPSRFQTREGFVKIEAEKPTFTMAEDAKYTEICWKILKQKFKDLSEKFYVNDESILAAIKSPYNFREEIYPVISTDPPIGYKANRQRASSANSSLKNIIPELRTRLIEEGLAIEAVGRETDDMIRIWSLQAKEANEPYIVITNDKDINVVGGKFHNPKTNETYTVTDEEGIRFFYEQLLSGDNTDNIPGLWKIGPDKAHKALIGCDGEDEFQIVVQEMYKNQFGDDWRNQLLSNGKMLHLQRHEHDFFNLDDWLII